MQLKATHAASAVGFTPNSGWDPCPWDGDRLRDRGLETVDLGAEVLASGNSWNTESLSSTGHVQSCKGPRIGNLWECRSFCKSEFASDCRQHFVTSRSCPDYRIPVDRRQMKVVGHDHFDSYVCCYLRQQQVRHACDPGPAGLPAQPQGEKIAM